MLPTRFLRRCSIGIARARRVAMFGRTVLRLHKRTFVQRRSLGIMRMVIRRSRPVRLIRPVPLLCGLLGGITVLAIILAGRRILAVLGTCSPCIRVLMALRRMVTRCVRTLVRASSTMLRIRLSVSSLLVPVPLLACFRPTMVRVRLRMSLC